VTDSPCNSRPPGSPTCRQMTGPILLRILDLVRDGQLSRGDVALLTERYRNPGFGYKRLARLLGTSVRTVGRRWKRLNRLALSLVE
jgi:hypothetical protein